MKTADQGDPKKQPSAQQEECIICQEKKADSEQRCDTCKNAPICDECCKHWVLTNPIISGDGKLKYSCPTCRENIDVPNALLSDPDVRQKLWCLFLGKINANDQDIVRNMVSHEPWLATEVKRHNGAITSAMHIAAEIRSIPIMRILQNHGGDLLLCIDGVTALQVYRDARLHDDDTDTDIDDEDTLTGFLELVKNNDLEEVASQIDRYPDVLLLTDMSDRTALHVAVHARLLDMINLLLRHMDVNSVDEYGNTALFHSQSPQMVQLLITAGSDVNKKNQFGMNPFRYNCCGSPSQKRVDILSILKDNGADIDNTDTHHRTALYQTVDIAIEHNDLTMPRYLIDNDCVDNINAVCGLATPQTYDLTALMLACKKEHVELVRLLLTIPDIDVDICNSQGFNASFFAENNAEILGLLEEHERANATSE